MEPFQITIVAAPKAKATAATVRDVALFEAAPITTVFSNHVQFVPTSSIFLAPAPVLTNLDLSQYLTVTVSFALTLKLYW